MKKLTTEVPSFQNGRSKIRDRGFKGTRALPRSENDEYDEEDAKENLKQEMMEFIDNYFEQRKRKGNSNRTKAKRGKPPTVFVTNEMVNVDPYCCYKNATHLLINSLKLKLVFMENMNSNQHLVHSVE